MLTYAKLLKTFSGEALLIATYLQNRSPTKALPGNLTPFEYWFGRTPNLSYLKVFVCTAHVLVPKEKRRKLDSHSLECIFLGYSNESRAYRLMQKDTKNIIISRDVLFDEHSLTTLSTPILEEQEDINQLFDNSFFQKVCTIPSDDQLLQQPQRISLTPATTPQPQPQQTITSADIQPHQYQDPNLQSSLQADLIDTFLQLSIGDIPSP